MLDSAVAVYSIFIIFFFSSRRRHTRFSRDWSSDVCSSDLGGDALVVTRGSGATARGRTWASNPWYELVRMPLSRSEERRVGKECRSRWSQHHEEKRHRRRGERRNKDKTK